MKKELQEVFNLAETLWENPDLKSVEDDRLRTSITFLSFSVMALCQEVEGLRYQLDLDGQESSELHKQNESVQRVKFEAARNKMREDGVFQIGTQPEPK
ncbi:hypothetical protein [Gimesia sp.]|uniref:hypothetical protein n=1 Tax=Gimesia sp. TaxID=2024833 RepID=UPI0025BB6DA9|nr:hypothetical protein [Gimesia sp.]